ncbi:CD209 antigen-like protein D isoform X1 [Silurus meridionalis]|uniref:CD209 antigen-like protein D isoform X1 n=1 Tax=Silurus meridionalis TaxID=175797 RepID=UPI001EEAA1A1|nr:CD209 antigen-like protein D isoform X1 [Silurus meridionalis]KAI5087693.1 CD209 antigen [Silurus meridionalis]
MALHLDMRVQREQSNYQNVQREKKTPPSPGRDAQYRGAFRLAGVCIGLMCIVQATLNVVLRLYLLSQKHTEQFFMDCENYTLAKYNVLNEEKRQLDINYLSLGKVRDQLQQEKDQLQRKYSNFDVWIRASPKLQLLWVVRGLPWSEGTVVIRRQLRIIDAAEDLRMGWVSFRSSLYFMSKENKTWTQSQDDCIKKNANLVIITSREEQDFIELFRRGKPAWIGLNNQNTERLFKWVDGTPLQTPFWWTQEPNNRNGDENCVETDYSPEDGRPVVDVLNTWNDNTCSAKKFWICEKTISI